MLALFILLFHLLLSLFIHALREKLQILLILSHVNLTGSLLDEHASLRRQVLADDLAWHHIAGFTLYRLKILLLWLLFANEPCLRQLRLVHHRLVDKLALTLIRVHEGFARFRLRCVGCRHRLRIFVLARDCGLLVAPRSGTVTLGLCHVASVARRRPLRLTSRVRLQWWWRLNCMGCWA